MTISTPNALWGVIMEPAQTLSRYRLTIEDFEKISKIGIFKEDDRVELLEGEMIKMAPIGEKHMGVVLWLDKLFNTRLSTSSSLISVQNPIQLDNHSELYPDIAILKHRDDFYTAGKPTAVDVLLVVEVADTTLSYDRQIKIPLYARHHIPEAWLIDLPNKRLKIFLEPNDNQYQKTLRPNRLEQIVPSTIPEVSMNLTGMWDLLT